MAVQEPNDSAGLWARVKPLSGWPDTDEDAMSALAGAWRNAAQAFTPTKVEPNDIRQAWRDPAGATYATQVADTIKLTEAVRVSCRQLGDHVTSFASIAARAKRDISTVVTGAAENYAKLPTTGPSRDNYVHMVAAEVNRLIKDAATAVENLDSGVTTQTPSQNPFAEYDHILGFITDEMTRNANSPDAQRIRDLLKDRANPFTSLWNKGKALGDWYDLVKSHGPWDHKSRILGMTVGDNTFTPMPGVPGQVRYDIWSNIHYGYVGTRAGLDDLTLHGGANAADLVENGHTDPSDQAAIQVGIDLAHQYGPDALRPENVTQAIMDNYDKLSQAGAIRPM